MPQTSTNGTFKPQAMPNTTGVGTVAYRQFAVEFFVGDPPDLVQNFPRIWVNITTGTLKFTVNGTTIKTVTAT